MTAALAGSRSAAVVPQVSTPCLAKLNGRPWHTTLAIRTGGLYTGVRVDTPGAAEALEDLLAPLRAPEMDALVPPNFSIELGDGSNGERQKRLGLIYRDHEIVGRGREKEALLVDLVELLDEIPLLGVTERFVVHAAALVTPRGEAVLIPGRLHKALLVRRQQLVDAGFELLRTRVQQIATAPAEPAVLPLGSYDEGLAKILAERGDSRTRIGRYPVRTWCTPAIGNEPFELRPAQAVFAASSMVLNRYTVGMRQTLQGLLQAATGSRFVGMPEMTSVALASAVISVSGQGLWMQGGG